MKPINCFQLFKKTVHILSLLLFLTLIIFSCIDDDDIFNQCPTCETCKDCPETICPVVCSDTCTNTTCPDIICPVVCPDTCTDTTCPNIICPVVCPDTCTNTTCPNIICPVCPNTSCPACICKDSFPILPITITSLSTDFLVVGETLTINGKNFINDSIGSKVVINGSSFDVMPTSNTEIKLRITEEMSTKMDSLFVKIGDSVSVSRRFFVVPKGWYKINAFETDEVVKSFVFDNTNSLISLVDLRAGTSSFSGNVERLKADSTGYKRTMIRIIPFRTAFDLEMFNKDVGVYTDVNATGYFTSDSFESTPNAFGNFTEEDSTSTDRIRILFNSENTAIISNSELAHTRTNNRGINSSFMSFQRNLVRSLVIYYSVKATDGFFYSTGTGTTPGGSINFVLKSSTFTNWGVVPATSIPDNGNIQNAKFIDINTILSTTPEDDLVISRNMTETWSVIRSNVDSFFIRSNEEWYIVSEGKVLSTKDGGSNWNEELELSANSRVNHMFFSNSKIILSGVSDGNSLLYIKHE